MTEKQFIDRLISLTKKMSDIYDSEPIDQNALDEVRREIYEACSSFNHRQRVSPWIISFVIICAILYVLYLVGSILYESFVLGH